MRTDLEKSAHEWAEEAVRAAMERDDARRLHGALVLDASRQVAALVARAEAAEASHAAIRAVLRHAHLCGRDPCASCDAIVLVVGGHDPGAVLLEEREKILRSLRSRDMPGVDLAGDVESVLVSYGQALRTMAALTAELSKLRAELDAERAEVELKQAALNGQDAALARLSAQVAAADVLRAACEGKDATRDAAWVRLFAAMEAYDASKGAS